MNSTALDSALDVMDRHITALNAGDSQGLIETLHFPHYRLSGVSLKIWDTSQHYYDDFLQRAGSDWRYSKFTDIKVVHTSENKVHLDAEIRRYRANDTLITHFRSLWVIVNIGDVWAAKFRSSFATQ